MPTIDQLELQNGLPSPFYVPVADGDPLVGYRITVTSPEGVDHPATTEQLRAIFNPANIVRNVSPLGGVGPGGDLELPAVGVQWQYYWWRQPNNAGVVYHWVDGAWQVIMRWGPTTVDNGTGKNLPPTGTITFSKNPAVIGDELFINVNASDADGTIARVQLFNGDALMEAQPGSPYIYKFVPQNAGTFSFTAKITDDDGATAITEQARLSVTKTALPTTPAPAFADFNDTNDGGTVELIPATGIPLDDYRVSFPGQTAFVKVGETLLTAGNVTGTFRAYSIATSTRAASPVATSPQFTTYTPGNTTPAAPTNAIVDDAANTFDYTANPNYPTVADYEYTLNAGVAIQALLAKPLAVGNVAKAPGQVGVRVKAAPGRNVSPWLFNATAFTVTTAPSVNAPIITAFTITAADGNGTSGDTNKDFTFTATAQDADGDDITTIRYTSTVSGASFDVAATPPTTSFTRKLPVGVHTFSVRAQDASPEIGPFFGTTRTVTVTAPVVTPTTYDNTVTGGNSLKDVTLGAQSGDTLEFDNFTGADNSPLTMELWRNNEQVGAVPFAAYYNTRPFRYTHAASGQKYTKTFTAGRVDL